MSLAKYLFFCCHVRLHLQLETTQILTFIQLVIFRIKGVYACEFGHNILLPCSVISKQVHWSNWDAHLYVIYVMHGNICNMYCRYNVYAYAKCLAAGPGPDSF